MSYSIFEINIQYISIFFPPYVIIEHILPMPRGLKASEVSWRKRALDSFGGNVKV